MRFRYRMGSTGYRPNLDPPSFESLIGDRVAQRTCPTMAEQVVEDLAGMPLAVVRKYCEDIGATVTYSDYWGHRRYFLADKSVVVVPGLVGPLLVVDATDRESIRKYCANFGYDSREVNYFVAQG